MRRLPDFGSTDGFDGKPLRSFCSGSRELGAKDFFLQRFNRKAEHAELLVECKLDPAWRPRAGSAGGAKNSFQCFGSSLSVS